ncbi:MAG: hypothetical protein CM1200mP2_22030 [Planctomycetaceae bacterium]|nr:MAG: hypothetical protein CM1200mP2_22030 [Planctomycetaceae bacterium]
MTTWYTERAVKFIEKNKNQPFFLYVPHSMPHVPLYVSDKFQGKSQRGLYGDVIMEIDWSVGQIVAALKKHKLDRRTLVIFTSDNGPWLNYGTHSGLALPLREGKGTTWDGGQREPTVMWWPGQVPAGHVCREVAGTIDILPTLAKLAGIRQLPQGHKIDGHDIWPLIPGARRTPGARTRPTTSTGDDTCRLSAADAGNCISPMPIAVLPDERGGPEANRSGTSRSVPDWHCSTWPRTSARPPTSSATTPKW